MSTEGLPVVPAQFTRSMPWMSLDDFRTLRSSTIAIAGLGAVGSSALNALARMGVGSFRVADPDTIAATDVSRHAFATLANLGQLKTAAATQLLKSIDPDCRCVEFPAGLNDGNIREFLVGADVVIDAVDTSVPQIAGTLGRTATEDLRLPVFLGIELGFGSAVTCFHPGNDGLPGQVRDFYGDGDVDLGLFDQVPHVPSYASSRMLDALARGEIANPTTFAGGQQVGSVLAAQIVNLILRPDTARLAYPEFLHFDPLTGMRWIGDHRREGRESLERLGEFEFSNGAALEGKDYRAVEPRPSEEGC